MKTAELPQPLRGVVPPLLSPLTARDRLDHAGLERLIEHVLAGGVHGLFLLGTTGEGPSLGYRLRCELIERACEQVDGRVPVLVGVTDTSYVESLALAEHAADSGATAVVLSAPFYFPAGQSELTRYVEALVDELPLPTLLYNMPSHTKLAFEPETVRRLIEIPAIHGMKDSSGDLDYFREISALKAEVRPDWTLLIGPEELLAESIRLGGHGGVNGGANLHPRLYVDLYKAAATGDDAEAQRLQAEVRRIAETIYRIDRGGAAVIKGLKCAMASLGICDDFMAEPFHRLVGESREQIERHLRSLSIPSPAEAPR